MNIFTNNLKTNFVSLLPTMCAPQKMQYHHQSSTSPLQNLIGNNVLQNSSRSFRNPNYFDQNIRDENIPSSYNKINQFEVSTCTNEEIKKPQNLSEMIETNVELEKTDFGSEIIVEPSTNILACNKKRKRQIRRNRRKIPEKHNRNREILNEMMDLDNSYDSTDLNLASDDEQQMEHTESLKLCDLLRIPEQCSSSPVPITVSPKTTCFAFSISPPKTANIRQRYLSTTESEDSFIVFDSGTDEECDFSEDPLSDTEDNESDTDSPSSIVPTKKVRFADGKELCEVHPMIQWSFAYQAARKGPWEIYARDRERFKNRIKMVSKLVEHCLQPEHRRKIYEQRFKENEN